MKFHIPKLDANKLYELDSKKYIISSFSVGPHTPKPGCWINCEILGAPDSDNCCFSASFWEVHFGPIEEWDEVECQFGFYQKIQDKHNKHEIIVTTAGYYSYTDVVWYNNSICDSDAILSGTTVGFRAHE